MQEYGFVIAVGFVLLFAIIGTIVVMRSSAPQAHQPPADKEKKA
jgi:hypothetical protein